MRTKRGFKTYKKRLVLSVLRVDAFEPLVVFHSRLAKKWAWKQGDRIYTCSPADEAGATLRDAEARVEACYPHGSATNVSPSVVEELGKAEWLVTYGTKGDEQRFRFGLRSHARSHNITGPNKITLKERVADFRGKVVVGRAFARFPATEDDERHLTPKEIGVKRLPGRSYGTYNIQPGTKLRAWFDATFSS